MTSARIIKAQSVRDLAAKPAFNFADLHREAESVMAQAHQAAAQVLARAEQDAAALYEQTRSAARAAGLQDAQAEILRQAADQASRQVHDQLQTALPAVKAAAEALQAERDHWLIRWEQTAIRVGVAIAEKLLKARIATRPQLATGMISDALRLAAGQARITVHLHPEDLAAWGDQAPRVVESLTACADSTLVGDPAISRGGCRIETLFGEIDARVETMLERLARELVDG